MPTITPFLWFQNEAEEAMQFYTSVFKSAKVLSVSRAGDRVTSAQFELEGQRFIVLNGARGVTFTEAVSFFVGCETQQEIDELWGKLLSGGGTPSRCGWLKDRFGVSWQVVPNALGRMLSDADPAKAGRVVNAMLAMEKLDLAALQRAHDGS